jgi:hypothetical protein
MKGLFHDAHSTLISLSWFRLVSLACAAYVVLGFAFAGALVASKGMNVTVKGFDGSEWSRVLYFSLSNLVSLGCEFGTPRNTAALWLVIVARVFGSVLNLVFLVLS